MLEWVPILCSRINRILYIFIDFRRYLLVRSIVLYKYDSRLTGLEMVLGFKLRPRPFDACKKIKQSRDCAYSNFISTSSASDVRNNELLIKTCILVKIFLTWNVSRKQNKGRNSKCLHVPSRIGLCDKKGPAAPIKSKLNIFQDISSGIMPNVLSFYYSSNPLLFVGWYQRRFLIYRIHN